MKKSTVYKIKRTLCEFIPFVTMLGSGVFLAHNARKHGMDDICDWVANHGQVTVNTDDGRPFVIVKKEEGA